MKRLADRLAGFGAFEADDHAALEAFEGEIESCARGGDLAQKTANSPRLIIAGWGCQMRPDPVRRRQIFGFLLPGDVIGSFYGPVEFAFFHTRALTRTFTLDLGGLLAPDAGRPQVLRAARRAESHAQHRLFDHIVRLGARDAYGGLAHLLLELHARLFDAGLADDNAFDLPIGQRVLAQAMGFSVAHTNHTMKRLYAEGLIEVLGERVRLIERERMKAIAQFDDAQW